MEEFKDPGYKPSERMIDLMSKENTVRMIYGDQYNNVQSIL